MYLQSKDNTYKGHNDSVDQLCWHPSQPHLLVTASIDKTIRIWDIRSTPTLFIVFTCKEDKSTEFPHMNVSLLLTHMKNTNICLSYLMISMTDNASIALKGAIYVARVKLSFILSPALMCMVFIREGCLDFRAH